MLLSRFAFAALLVGVAAGVAVAAPVHPHVHHALHELALAKNELKVAPHDFGGHKVKAIAAIDAAIVQTEKALLAAGDGYKSLKRDLKIYKKHPHHPHLHQAVLDLKLAHDELKAAKGDFKGHRAKALVDINLAIKQIELALKFAKPKI